MIKIIKGQFVGGVHILTIVLKREEPAHFLGWNDAKLASVTFAGGGPGRWVYVLEGQPFRDCRPASKPDEMIKAFTDLMIPETLKVDL